MPIIFDPIEALNLCLKPPQLRTYYCNQSKTAFSQLNKILALNLQFTYSILFQIKSWDEEMAREAQKWANNCVFEHTYGVNYGM